MRVVVHVHDLPMWSIPTPQVDRIREAYPDLEVLHVRDHAACADVIGDAEVLLATRMKPETLRMARRLRWVHSSAVGVGTLPLAELRARGVMVTNSRGVHAGIIAEHALALVLALRRRLPLAARRQAAVEWAQEELAAEVIPALAATTILVVGLGEIGSRVAAMASALGMRVIGIRRRLDQPVPAGVSDVRSLESLSALLAEADIIVLALPRTEATGTLLGERELASMKPGALLVNVARGDLVDEHALAWALAHGPLAAAGLDAFVHEPLSPASPLWSLPNVLITPHSAAFDGDYWTPAVDCFLANLQRFRQGQPLLNVVDAVQGY